MRVCVKRRFGTSISSALFVTGRVISTCQSARRLLVDLLWRCIFAKTALRSENILFRIRMPTALFRASVFVRCCECEINGLCFLVLVQLTVP